MFRRVKCVECFWLNVETLVSENRFFILSRLEIVIYFNMIYILPIIFMTSRFVIDKLRAQSFIAELRAWLKKFLRISSLFRHKLHVFLPKKHF